MVNMEARVENSFVLDISLLSRLKHFPWFYPSRGFNCNLYSDDSPIYISIIDHDAYFQTCGRLYYCFKLFISSSWKKIILPGLCTTWLAMLLFPYTSLPHWCWLWPCDLLQLKQVWRWMHLSKKEESLQGWPWAGSNQSCHLCCDLGMKTVHGTELTGIQQSYSSWYIF